MALDIIEEDRRKRRKKKKKKTTTKIEYGNELDNIENDTFKKTNLLSWNDDGSSSNDRI